jgi:hypothetical protein
MAHQFSRSLLLTALFSCAIVSSAQSTASPKAAHAASNADVPFTPGESAIPLNGPWKFQTGDNPQWADPGFDDSGWQDYTIDPEHPAQTAAQTLRSNELPGWQQHGHPGYTGYAWYRIRLQAGPDSPALALLMPQYVDDAFEVYIDGTKIGSFGKLDGWRIVYPGQAKLFRIPAGAHGDGRPIDLAIRIWSQREEALPSEHNLDGGLRGVPLLGSPELLEVFRQSEQEQTYGTLWTGWLLTGLFGGVGIISLFLFCFSTSQREYLWAGISLTGIAVLVAFEVIVPAMEIPVLFADIVRSITSLAGYFALPLAAMCLLGVSKPIWRRANYLLMGFNLARSLASTCLLLGLLPPTTATDQANSISLLAALLTYAMLLLAIAVDGVRTIGRKAWLPLTPGLLCACGLVAAVIQPVPIQAVGIYYYFYVSVPLAVLVIFLMRFAEQQRENVRLVDDMRQAQEVQQVMLPEAHTHFPGFSIESEYRPAREVGGDFFQIIPHKSDGSFLIVAGDVTGKGLKAGMLVALLVGAIRTAARLNLDPLAVLGELNQRLLGRSDAQATCLAMRIGAEGKATLANAGHLPPYLNGEPLTMNGALPLGMVEAAEFSLMQFQLKNGDKLVLMSDGIAEATDVNGKLYGFERAQQLLRTATTAADIAAEAQRFGQKDDISVISVTCTGVRDSATT